jgi:N-acetylglucosamine kinase-like BadF-type ATPase
MKRFIAYAFAITILCIQSLAASSLTREVCEADYIFCIDGGGSKTSLQVINSKHEVLDIERDGKTTQTLSAGPTNINIVGFDVALANLVSLFKDIKVGPNHKDLKDIQSKSVVCGLAGLANNQDKVGHIQYVLTAFGFKATHIVIGTDADIAKQVIGETGAVLIAGTGSICFSKKKKDAEPIRIGGYGWMFGDGGSGVYFGKRALVEAWSHFDQKKEPFVLTEQLCQLFKVPAITDVRKLFYTDGTLKASDVAKAAPLVFEAAFVHNNPECTTIVDEGAAELAELINDAIEDRGEGNFPIYLVGGIFKDKDAARFIDMIRRKVVDQHGVQLINMAHENVAIEAIKKAKF